MREKLSNEQLRNEKFLNELIQLFHEERVVEKLVQVQEEKGLVGIYTVYNELKRKFMAKTIKLRQYVCVAVKDKTTYINNDSYEIDVDDALQVCFICIMSNISEANLLKNWFQLISALKAVEGEYQKLAGKFIKFLSVESGCQGENFTTYNTAELLEMFFCD